MPDDQVEGTEASSEGDSEVSPASSTELAELKDMVKGLTTKLEEQKKANDNLLFDPDMLDKLGDQSQTGTSDSEQGGDVAFDPDTASNADIVNYLSAQIEAGNAATSQQVAAQLEQLIGALKLESAQNDLDKAALKYPDLETKMEDKKYKERFYNVAKDNPSWKAKKVYKQVEMEIAHEERQAAKVAEAKAEAEFTASSEKGGAPASVVQEKDMSAEEAAEDAWRRTMGTKQTMLD